MRTARTLLGATVLLVGLLPQMAGACVAAYMDFNVDTVQGEVEAWAQVEDYYSSSPCFGEAYSSWQYWEHLYEAYVQIQSPTTNSAYDYDSTWYVPYGGGSASPYAYLSVQGDPGVYTIDWGGAIFCTVGGWFFGSGGGGAVEVPLYASYNEWPTDECNVNRGYTTSNPIHLGIDVDATDYGTDVVSMEDGTVVDIRNTGTPGGEENFVIVQGSDGMYTIYSHVAPSVVKNQTVSAGQKIGEVDNTGDTSGSHVHIARSPSTNGDDAVDFELPDCP